ncbi:MAG: hydantoinase/oxoprolinase family protein [Saccharofermentanales bacterium]
MKYGLGIDTGGTYTDAVIFDFENNRVIGAAKSITYKEDLTVGINGAIGQLSADILRQTAMVSLSTTLATNACVEGKGSRAKLVMIGSYRDVVSRYGNDYGLPGADDIIFLDGGHNQQGETVGEPDWELLKSDIMRCTAETDVFAVVEVWGIRNADFEKKAKELIGRWTGKQAVCGYELTGEINSLKRAASAYLNARLIPIINDFLDAVRTSLDQRGIHVPLVIVRGDGSLMSEEFAREKPVETLLCGPAASVSGGISLTGEKNCIIIDMGGTTSDIAIARDGIPRLATEGAAIGKWRTGINSIMINTVGLGGDSLIRRDSQGSLKLGPGRAAPLSWTASTWPDTLGTMRKIFETGKKHSLSLCEFFYLIRDISGDPYYTGEEQQISDALKNGALSITGLAEAIGSSIYEIKTARLEQLGIIMRCGLTPTDIMHLTGAFTSWHKDAAFYGACIMANQLDVSLEEFIDVINEKVKEKLYYNIVLMLLEDADETILRGGVSRQLDHLITSGFRNSRAAAASLPDGGQFLEHRFRTDATLVGIGAPIHIYLPDVAKALGTRYAVPENAGVANAIGAITGNVVVEEKITIKPVYTPGGISEYIAFSTIDRVEFKKLQDAVAWARAKAHEMAYASALARGARDFELSVTVYYDEVDISGMRENGTHRIVAEKDTADMTAAKSHDPEKSAPVGQKDQPAISPEEPSAADAINSGAQEEAIKMLLLEATVIARAIGKISLLVQ